MAVTKLSNSGITTGVLKYDSMLAGNPPYDPAVFDSIATATGQGNASITFSGIPSTYQHLQIRGITKSSTTTGSTTYWDINFNGDTTASYSRHRINASGTTVGVVAEIGQTSLRAYSLGSRGTDSSRVGAAIIDIHDYVVTNKNKTMRQYGSICTGSASVTETSLSSGTWLNTAAITSITITIGAGTFDNSVISLYGIKA